MQVLINTPTVTRVWWPMRVFQRDLGSDTEGKLVTLGFGQKCVVTVKQGGLSGNYPTLIFQSYDHAKAQWMQNVTELIVTNVIKVGLMQSIPESNLNKLVESLYAAHGIQTKPLDVIRNYIQSMTGDPTEV